MDRISPQHRSWNMSRIRGRDTKPEMTVRRLLHGMGYRYVLHSSKLAGRPDLVFPARRKAVFVHGCFWHMHECRAGSVVPSTRSDFWQKKRGGNVDRDRINLKALRREGWRVFVVWECEIKRDAKFLRRLTAFLDR
jgi:DNA mismatch endonuclease, patch repair protein